MQLLMYTFLGINQKYYVYGCYERMRPKSKIFQVTPPEEFSLEMLVCQHSQATYILDNYFRQYNNKAHHLCSAHIIESFSNRTNRLDIYHTSY